MKEVEERKRRRAILTYLLDAHQNEASAALAVHACRAQGVPTYLAQAEISIQWLEEQGLVTTQEERGFVAAKLTPSGAEVARDERSMRGVERPLG